MAGKKKSSQTGKYAGKHKSTNLTRRGEVEVQKAMRILAENGYIYGGGHWTLSKLRKLNTRVFEKLAEAYNNPNKPFPTAHRMKKWGEEHNINPEEALLLRLESIAYTPSNQERWSKFVEGMEIVNAEEEIGEWLSPEREES